MSNGETSNAVLAFVKKRPGELAAATMSVIAVGAVVAALTVSSGQGANVAEPIDTVAVPDTTSVAASTANSSDVVNLHMLAQPLASLPAERVGSAQKTALEDALKQVKDALSATASEADSLQTAYTALQNAVGGMATSTLALGREHRLQVTLASSDILTAYDAALIELGDAADDHARTSGISAVVRQGTAAQSSHSAAVDSQQGEDTNAPEPPLDDSGGDEPTQAPAPSDPVPPALTAQPVPDGPGASTPPAEPEETPAPTEPPAPDPTEGPIEPQPTGEPTATSESGSTPST
ncbi:hypothetical protein C5E10_08825 [Pseudoclavibacter sp. RFBG4]|uniref:hypothetical protein n=1 Tax=Pseudoclavibacter sp. RFBG4 TaxID=2080575 RepID=UPI000CE77B7B|nr:hypothetical protein [Pseudoclavibacter sp. RFBG4]PPG33895.1 hypothetical protein C5E10_08825 [Pseudoclavibacter sp. RFBG4]